MPATRVDVDLAALLSREGRRLRFAAGQVIQLHGDASDGFWLIETGTVTLCRIDADGDATVFAVLGSGDLFGELAHFAEVPRQVDALTESDAVLVRIDAALVKRLIAGEPNFARLLLRSLANQLRFALDRIDSDRSLSAAERLTRALAEMARREGSRLALTQQALADYVGVSRVTAGQVLRELAMNGLIEIGYRQLVVPDPDKLAAPSSMLARPVAA